MTWAALTTWISRATGIGYKSYGPLVGNEIDPREELKKRRRADELVLDIEKLEKELARRNII